MLDVGSHLLSNPGEETDRRIVESVSGSTRLSVKERNEVSAPLAAHDSRCSQCCVASRSMRICVDISSVSIYGSRKEM